MNSPVLRPTLLSVAVRAAALPNDFVLELVLPENLVEHDFDVVGGVPVAVIVEAAGRFEHPVQLDAARAHELNIGLRGGVPVFEGALLFGLAPEHFIVAIRVERRVDVDEIDARRREFLKLLKAVAAPDDTRVHQRGRFRRRSCGR